MKTNEIFEHVLQIVCEECELCYGELINGGTQTQTCQRRVLLIGRGEIPSLFKNIKKQCYEPTIRHL